MRIRDGCEQLIAVVGDPLSDIGVLRVVPFVMKAGRVAKRDGVMTSELRFDLEHRY